MYIRKKYIKTIKIIVCILVLVIVVFGIFFHFNENFRVNFMNYMIELNESNTDFSFSNSSSSTYSDDKIELRYLPDGYMIEINRKSDESTFMRFKNGELYFDIALYSVTGNYSIDTENATIEEIVINNCDGIYSSNQNVNILVWNDDVNGFRVAGNISKDEIIKIAENFKVKPDNNSVIQNDKRVKFNYLPEGSELVQNSSTKSHISLHYDKGEQYFSFSTNDIDDNISIDTEDAIIENLTINNCEAMLSLKTNANILLWHNSETIFKVMGNIPKEEMIKIAENVEILG